jgi:hypothetical protein
MPSMPPMMVNTRTYLRRLRVEGPRHCIAADARTRKIRARPAPVPLYPHRGLGKARVDDLDDCPSPPLMESCTHSHPQPAVGSLLPHTPPHDLFPSHAFAPHFAPEVQSHRLSQHSMFPSTVAARLPLTSVAAGRTPRSRPLSGCRWARPSQASRDFRALAEAKP